MTLPHDTYRDVRTANGGFVKGLYDNTKDLDDRMEDVEAGVVAAGSISTTELANNAVNYAKLDATGRTYKLQIRHAVAEATAATDFEKAVGACTAAGTVTSVKFIPDAGFGQATDYATLAIINKGAAGSGTTSVASLGFNSSNVATAYVPSALTLGATGNLAVVAGDVLTLKKTHSGNGQLVPTGELQITIERTA